MGARSLNGWWHGLDPNGRDPATQGTALRTAGEQPDIVRLLVEHGADLDALDEYGLAPVVHFVGTRAWDAALILIEKGARLDIANADGVSLDTFKLGLEHPRAESFTRGGQYRPRGLTRRKAEARQRACRLRRPG